jgi:hypothetical protein
VTVAPARSATSPAAATSQVDIPDSWTNASNRPLPTYARASDAEPIERAARTSFEIARARLATDRPASESEMMASDSFSLVEAWTARPLSVAGPSAVAANVSPRVGSRTAPATGRPSTTKPIDTQNTGRPLA